MNKEQEIKEKWSGIKSQPEDSLKQIAKDLYNGLIYTDRHCEGREVMNTFMVLLFMGPKSPESPKYPSENKDIQGQRDNVLYDITQRDKDQKQYEDDMKWYDVEVKYYNEIYIKTIGLIYEYLDSPNRSPMAINGKPIFMSCRFLNIEDTKKMFEYYETYKEIREKADNF